MHFHCHGFTRQWDSFNVLSLSWLHTGQRDSCHGFTDIPGQARPGICRDIVLYIYIYLYLSTALKMIIFNIPITIDFFADIDFKFYILMKYLLFLKTIKTKIT